MTDEKDRAPESEGNGADPDGPIELDESQTRDPPRPHRPKGGKVEGPGLLDDFDEDEDLTSDPEVEQIVRGVPVEKARPRERPRKPPSPEIFASDLDAPPGEPFCASGAWKGFAALGGVLVLLAGVLAGVYADHAHWAHVLITLYWALLHTGTGLGALVLAAMLLGRRVGSFEGAAARMLVAVALFLAVYSLDIPLTQGKLEEVVLAAGAYFGGLVVAFRLMPRDAAVIGGAHFGVALLLWLGGLLRAIIASGGAGG
jgi:hypothetical protein